MFLTWAGIGWLLGRSTRSALPCSRCASNCRGTWARSSWLATELDANHPTVRISPEMMMIGCARPVDG